MSELTIWVCKCCMLATAYCDESECRDFYNHKHPACSDAVTAVEVGAVDNGYRERVCEGCDQPVPAGAAMYRARAILRTVNA